jgi:hypothetical protein
MPPASKRPRARERDPKRDASAEQGSERDPNVSVDDASLLPAVRAFMALARQLAAEEEK